MKKLFLFILLTCLSVTAFGQSGIYMDVDRKGEGITVFDWTDLHGMNQVTFYFYTYNLRNNQRWLLGSAPWDEDTQESTGLLYETEGVNYPVGIPSDEPFEQDVQIVGEPFVAGEYVLRKGKEGGYLLWVSRLPEPKFVEDRDYLFDRAWFFTFPLIQLK